MSWPNIICIVKSTPEKINHRQSESRKVPIKSMSSGMIPQIEEESWINIIPSEEKSKKSKFKKFKEEGNINSKMVLVKLKIQVDSHLDNKIYPNNPQNNELPLPLNK